MARTPPKTTVITDPTDLPRIELNNQGEVLQFQLHRAVHRLGRDPDWADLVVPALGWEVISSRHAVFCQEQETYRIFDGEGTGQPSTNSLFLNHTRIPAATGYLLEQSVQLEIGQDPSNLILLTYIPSGAVAPTAIPTKQHWQLSGCQEWVLGRELRGNYNAINLPAPTVSRRHATLRCDDKGHYLLQDHSTNGTFVNGLRLDRPHRLQEGDTIRVGPFTLVFRQTTLQLLDRGNQVRLDAHNLMRQVRTPAGEKSILNHVSLVVEPGQLVAIVGGSGAGKSTLIKSLLGIEPITEGEVFLNGSNLHQHFDLFRSEIGYVPQDDIVHQELTVAEVLSYACQLRLPPETGVAQIVQQTLAQVKLTPVRHNLVRDLSGGQRKRVSIAVELLADPKLLFLDEPTSGLDPGLDKEIMHLLRELANQGRTIVLVTHATSNIEVCDRVAFLGWGGRLCYFGPPHEAMNFFQMPSQDLKYFADIYIKLDEAETEAEKHHNVYEWAMQFQQSRYYSAYIAAALSTGYPEPGNSTGSFQRAKISFWRQWLLLSRRSQQLLLRDRVSFGFSLLTAPLGIALITLALADQVPLAKLAVPELRQAPLALRVLFVFTCATIWVGLSTTMQAIVKEASIYARERLINLGLLPYIGSKLLVYASLAGFQTLLITAIVLIGFESPQPELAPWPLGLAITTYLSLLASVSLGLMLSALVKNPHQANTLLPLILLPQTIFSGVLFKLEGGVRVLSWLMLSRWSVGAYGSLVDVNTMVPKQLSFPGGQPIPLPFEPTPVYDATWQNLNLNWSLLSLHALIYLTITLWLQKRKDVF